MTTTGSKRSSRRGSYLDGQLLIAMPGMRDQRFARSVIYMCAHSKDGAMGIIINKVAPMLSFGELASQIDLFAGSDITEVPFDLAQMAVLFELANELNRTRAPQTASLLVGMEPLFSMFGMPIFGFVADRFGRRALFMMFGSMLLVPVFLMLGYTNVPPVVPMAMMGVAFAMVPVIMWPALVFVVTPSRLGMANGMLDTIQQVGLVVVNLLIGWSNDHWLASASNAAGYRPSMWIFTGIAVLAVVCAFVLRRIETGPHAHGLEMPTGRNERR